MRTKPIVQTAAAGLFATAALWSITAALAQEETVRIDGSTGVRPLAVALAEVFMARQPSIAIEIGDGLGGKKRIAALEGGSIDIATASHGLNIEELSQKGMEVHRIAVTPVVFAVSSDVELDALTDEQICSIYAGEVTNWSELNGPDLAIAAFTRPASEVDAEVMIEGLDCLTEATLSAGATVAEKAGDMANALKSTPGSIGMTSGTIVEQSDGKLQALALNGVSPNQQSVQAGEYQHVREAFLVTAGNPPQAVSAFLAFVGSPDGAAVISANGAFPIGN